MNFRTLKVVLALLLVFVFASAAFAQETLDDELRDRILASAQSSDRYDSFMVNLVVTGDQITSAEFDGQNIEQSTTFSNEYSVTIIRGENPMGYGTVTAGVEYVDQTSPFAYSVQAEVRYIDGVLYVNGSYLEGGDGLPPLPEGWVIVEDPDMDLDYGTLELGRIVSWVDNEDDEENVVDSLQSLLEAATSVTVTDDEVDGIVVEVITVTFGWEGVFETLTESAEDMGEDPFFTLIGEQLAEEGELMTVSVSLDGDENIRANSVTFTLDVSEIPGDSLGIPGGTISMILSNSENTTYSQINEEFEFVEAPEIETGS